MRERRIKSTEKNDDWVHVVRENSSEQSAPRYSVRPFRRGSLDSMVSNLSGENWNANLTVVNVREDNGSPSVVPGRYEPPISRIGDGEFSGHDGFESSDVDSSLDEVHVDDDGIAAPSPSNNKKKRRRMSMSSITSSKKKKKKKTVSRSSRSPLVSMCKRTLCVCVLICILLWTFVALMVIFFQEESRNQSSPSSESPSPNKGSPRPSELETDEELFLIAQKVVRACSEDQLNKDLLGCQRLCKNYLCCFDRDASYNCALDIEEDCIAHAGCEALQGTDKINEDGIQINNDSTHSSLRGRFLLSSDFPALL